MGFRAPTADTTASRTEAQVVGHKSDTAATAVNTTQSISAYVKGLLTAAGAQSASAVQVVGTTSSLMAYVKGLLQITAVPVTSTGTADIDISAAVYDSDYVDLLTVTPAAGAPLRECVIDIDVNKATTGWDTVSTAADTIDFAVLSKIDGTNWRTLITGTQITANGDGSLLGNESGQRFNVGPVGEDEEVSLRVLLSAERADAEIPYAVTYVAAAAPTITPVAAGA